MNGNHHVPDRDRGGPVVDGYGAGDGPYGSWNMDEEGDLEKPDNEYIQKLYATLGETSVNLGDSTMNVVEHVDDRRVKYPEDEYDDNVYASTNIRRLAATLRRQ